MKQTVREWIEAGPESVLLWGAEWRVDGFRIEGANVLLRLARLERNATTFAWAGAGPGRERREVSMVLDQPLDDELRLYDEAARREGGRT